VNRIPAAVVGGCGDRGLIRRALANVPVAGPMRDGAVDAGGCDDRGLLRGVLNGVPAASSTRDGAAGVG
jgi:hypothetical protein